MPTGRCVEGRYARTVVIRASFIRQGRNSRPPSERTSERRRIYFAAARAPQTGDVLMVDGRDNFRTGATHPRRGKCMVICPLNASPETTTELSMGTFCVTRSNPTHQLTDPTQPNKWKNLDKTRPNPIQLTKLTAWCDQMLSDRALNVLT